VLFNYGTVEVLHMRWLKKDTWKAGIAFAGILLFLVLMVWVPVSAAGAHEEASGLATLVAGTVQATPTEDATVAALNKEKLAQEVQQLKKQNEPDLLGRLLTNVPILLAIGGGIFAVVRYFSDREAEREKRAEERFQKAVEGLGSERVEAKAGAAIMLRTFLQPGYEQFYRQTFDLAVTHLRRRVVDPKTPAPLDANDYVPLDPLNQALITVFKESFPLARNKLNQEKSQFEIEIKSLDTSRIQLDDAYLRGADLKHIQMREASLIKADLRKANLSGAYLTQAKLGRAILRKAILSGAWLHDADLSYADLDEAHLDGTYLRDAHFDGANLKGADLKGADFGWQAHLDDADLKGADLRGVKRLTKEQLEACKAKGAITDKGSTISSSQSPVSPPAPSQSNDA
jgi:uncharacterized protein YjbI with pentapeptide repeats